MKITVLDKKGLKLKLLVSGTNTTYMNTLRRAIVEEVPTMAIEDVEFFKNDSVMYDEILAHRLGLIPLTTPLDDYNFRETCTCGGVGCAKCQVKFTLKAKGPKTVYASELKSTDPNVKPVYPNIPIVKLTEGQTVELEATAELGRGKEHMKWSPGLAYYHQVADITINNDKIKDKEECAKQCPKKVLSVEGGKLVAKKDKIYDCDLCGACSDKCKEGIKVEPKEDEFIFYVESWGQLSTDEIVKRATQEIENKFNDFIESIKKA